MPSLDHDEPLDLLREKPGQVPTLLREALGLELPRFVAASLTDSDFTQLRPTSFHADLTVTLHGDGGDRRPVMGIIVEVQLDRDRRKRRSWPLYTAALHARLRCQTCLVVIAPNPSIARWAAAPIDTLQPGSPFTPLVIGPEQIPRVSAARARREPAIAVLSALAHGNSPGGVSIALAAVDVLSDLPDWRARVGFDRIRESLNEAAGRALEYEMQHGKYEYKSDFARRYFGEGLEKGRKEGREEGRLEAMHAILLQIAEQRFGLARNRVQRSIAACGDPDRLTALVAQIGAAPDRETVERLLADLEEKKPARSRAHRGTGPAKAAKAAKATRTAKAATATRMTRATTTATRTARASRARATPAARTATATAARTATATAARARTTRSRAARR
jgi:hypothetical protein